MKEIHNKVQKTNFLRLKISHLSDQELVRRSKENDQAALEILIQRHLTLVYSIAKYYTVDSDDAQDVAQEAFVKIWKNLKKFQTEKSFKSWVAEIAKNTSLDWLKKKKPIVFSEFENEYGRNVLAETLPAPSLSPIELINNADENKSLQTAINQLPPLYQEVVTLHGNKEMKFQEIADFTSRSIHTMKSRYRRALALLRKKIIKD